MDRIVFYLPVVTPWWLENVILPVIKKLEADWDIHVIVPNYWHGTGLPEGWEGKLAAMTNAAWHPLVGERYKKLRTVDSLDHDVISKINGLQPKFTVCRAANISLGKYLPGTVRYIMEASLPPLALPLSFVFTDHGILDQALIPELNAKERDLFRAFAQPLLDMRMKVLGRATVSEARCFVEESLELPTDRKLLILALEYAHEENFFAQHSQFGSGVHFLASMLSSFSDEFYFVVLDHPLNDLYVDRAALRSFVSANEHKCKLFSRDIEGAPTVEMLFQACDGLIVENSKIISLASYLGKPVLRFTSFQTGRWIGAYSNVASFAEAVSKGVASSASEGCASEWFGYHILNSVISLEQADLTSQDILHRLYSLHSPHCWARNQAYFKERWGTTLWDRSGLDVAARPLM